MSFILDDKGDHLMGLEVEHASGTYGNGAGVGGLTPTGAGNNLVSWRSWQAAKFPIFESAEEGIIARRMGQPLSKLGFSVKYSGSIELEELTLINTDVATPKLRPNVHMLLRTSAFGSPVFSAAGANSLTYGDETFPEGFDSIETNYHEYVTDATRNRHDMFGGLSDLQVTWEPAKIVLFEAINGMAIDLLDGVPVASIVDVVYSRTARVPFNSGTLVLETLGSGSVYPAANPIRKVVLRTLSNTFVTPDGRGAGGQGRVWNNPFEHAEIDFLVDEIKPADFASRKVWADGTVIHYTWSIPGPTVVANIFSGEIFAQIVESTPQRGPGGERLALMKCKILWSGGIGAVGDTNTFVWTSPTV